MNNKNSLLIAIIFLISICIGFKLNYAQQNFCQISPFGSITLQPDFELDGIGQNIDSIEFWKAPDSTESLMFVTAKGNSLVEIWKYPFINNEQLPLTHASFNNSNVNGLAIDQENNLLYVSIGEPSSTVSVFSLPSLTFIRSFNKNGVNYHAEPNLTLLTLSNGEKQIYVSADNIVYVHNASTGEYLFEFTPVRGLETMSADSIHQRIYIPDENNRSGVYVYNPDGSIYTQSANNPFGTTVFDSDAEGIFVYNCNSQSQIDSGKGLIVVSDQRQDFTQFEFFDRNSWEYLGNLKLNGVSNTDGIASFPYEVPGYPKGIFVAVNNDASVTGVGWDHIFDKISSPLNAPSNLTAVVIQHPLSTELTWSDNSDNEEGFIIERETSVEIFEIVDSVDKNITHFVDTNLSLVNYNYRVKAFNAYGNSAYSNIIQLEIPVELISFSAQKKSNGVLLKWATSTESNNMGFDIERNLDNQWQTVSFIQGMGNSTIVSYYQFLDNLSDVGINGIIDYRLKQIDYDGSFSYSQTININFDNIPSKYVLLQNYPNPFNPTTTIKYSLPVASFVNLKIFNALGEEVFELVNERKSAGVHSIVFDAGSLSNGVYFYRLRISRISEGYENVFMETKNMLLLK